MRATITVKNVGRGHEAQVGLRLGPLTPDLRNVLEFDKSQFGDLGDESKKVYLWPGETREITVVGTAGWLNGDNRVNLPVSVFTPINYGSGDRAPAALLRQAEAFRIVGDKVDARLSLQKVINRYPGTGEAAKASRMLSEIGG